jgi:hypothetical protein
LHRRKSCRGKQHETKFCHDDLNPRKNSGSTRSPGWTNEVVTINEYALGRIVAAFKGRLSFISDNEKSESAFVHCAFRPWFQTVLHIVPCGISDAPDMTSGSEPGKSVIPASVAGEGVLGPCGPRTGSSSGM